MRKLWVVSILMAQVLGCAQQPIREWYVVMPSADGHAGSITVTRQGTDTVLEGAYSSTRSGTAAVTAADPAQVQATFAAALQATPMRPVSFTLFFLADRDEVTAQSRAEFANVAREVTRRPAPQITVIGHADATLSHAHNDALSLRRAERVRADLISLGVDPQLIKTEGRGKRELLIPTPDNQPEPRNRRVEIEVR